MRAMKRTACGFLVTVAVVAVCVLVLSNLPSVARRALPTGASQVEEYYEGSANSDYLRLLKARVSEDGFKEFVTTLGLHSEFCDNVDVALVWRPMPSTAQWWDPLSSTQGTFCTDSQNANEMVVAKYERGTVYFAAFSW